MLRAVVTLARTQQFAQAAAELAMPRSSLSDQVAALEKILGGPLFTRSTHAAEVTPLGAEVVSWAEPVVRAHDRFLGWAESRSATATRTVRIGFLAGLDPQRLTPVLRATRDALPDWRFEVQQIGFLSAEQTLRSGRLDVVITAGGAHVPGLRGTKVWTEPRVVMLPAEHPLAVRASLMLTDLSDLPVIAPTAGRHPTARAWVVDPRPDGTRVRYGPSARNIDEVVQLVAAGLGINLTAASAELHVSHPDVVFVPVTDAPAAAVWTYARAGDHSLGVTTFEDAAQSPH